MAETESIKTQKSTRDWRSVAKSFYIYILLLLIVIVFSTMKLDQVQIFGRGHFLSPDSLINLLRMSIPIITLSGGFTLLMISGHIDLSVGSAMSLNAVVYAWLAIHGVPFLVSFALAFILGILLGFINGLLVVKLRITPVIATLVNLNLYKGIALMIVPRGVSAIKSGDQLRMPSWINNYGRQNVFLGLPAAFYVALAVIAILVILQRKTIIGKYSAAIGGNRTAAELSGINARKMVWLLYVIVGMLASLAGVARASYMSLGDPLSGDGMETDCIIAVLLGGTAFTGGEGSVIKTIVGALIIVCMTTGLMTVIQPYYQTFAKSVVLVLAVTLNHLLVRRRLTA
jgi:ribose/xylose/arabinose/galactoside ABC-type transport system permease subunit